MLLLGVAMAKKLRCPACQVEIEREALGVRYEDAKTEFVGDPDSMGFAFVPDEDATIDCPACGKAMNRLRAAKGDFDIGGGCAGAALVLVSLGALLAWLS